MKVPRRSLLQRGRYRVLAIEALLFSFGKCREFCLNTPDEIRHLQRDFSELEN